jgi:hypothetical protein
MIKSRALLMIVALLILILTGLLAGCGGGGGESSTIQGESNLIQGMKLFPSTGVEYYYTNTATVQKANFTFVPYQYAFVFRYFPEYGISLDDISWMAASKMNDAVVDLLSGNFSFDEVRSKLDKAGTKESYKGTEIWTGLDGRTTAIALRNGQVIGGNTSLVYECIDAINGSVQSLYDNVDLREVVSSLPEVSFLAQATTSHEELQDLPAGVTNCTAIANSYDTIDANTIGMTCVAKFREATSASNSLSMFKSLFNGHASYYENVQAVQEGDLIKVTATFPSSDWRH